MKPYLCLATLLLVACSSDMDHRKGTSSAGAPKETSFPATLASDTTAAPEAAATSDMHIIMPPAEPVAAPVERSNTSAEQAHVPSSGVLITPETIQTTPLTPPPAPEAPVPAEPPAVLQETPPAPMGAPAESPATITPAPIQPSPSSSAGDAELQALESAAAAESYQTQVNALNTASHHPSETTAAGQFTQNVEAEKAQVLSAPGQSH